MAQANSKVTISSAAPKALRKVSLGELVILLDATKLAAEAWNAIANQPRAWPIATSESPGSQLLEAEWERCNSIRDLIYYEASARKPKNFHEIEYRAQILIDRELHRGGWKEIVKLAIPTARAAERHFVRIQAAVAADKRSSRRSK